VPVFNIHDTIYESSQSCNRLQSVCHEFGVTLCTNQLVGKTCKSLDMHVGGIQCESWQVYVTFLTVS